MERWYALHTKPRSEFIVRDNLEQRGVQTYLPLLRAAGRRAARARREQPFFARYLFARLDLEVTAASSINWSQGMVGIVSYGGQPAVVGDPVIQWLQRRLAQLDGGVTLGGLPLLPGARLRVRDGPLAGLEAIFDRRRSAGDRGRVLVQLLGRLTACEIPFDWLERIP